MQRPAAVSCSKCGFGWNSSTMAEGLRLLGSCPRCGGTLLFRADAGTRHVHAAERAQDAGDRAPHLVLGLPRR